MKNYFLLLAIVSALNFVSCDKDKTDNLTNSIVDDLKEITEKELIGSNVIGVWKIKARINDGEEEELDECELQTSVEFKSDNKFNSMDYYHEVLFSEETEGFQESEECANTSNSGTWRINSDEKLEITLLDEGSEFTVQADFTVSDDILVLTFEYDDGEGEVTEGEVTYEKQ